MTKLKILGKRGLSLFIALMMCVSILPMSAFAAEGDAPAAEETIEVAEHIEESKDTEVPAAKESEAGSGDSQESTPTEDADAPAGDTEAAEDKAAEETPSEEEGEAAGTEDGTEGEPSDTSEEAAAELDTEDPESPSEVEGTEENGGTQEANPDGEAAPEEQPETVAEPVIDLAAALDIADWEATYEGSSDDDYTPARPQAEAEEEVSEPSEQDEAPAEEEPFETAETGEDESEETDTVFETHVVSAQSAARAYYSAAPAAISEASSASEPEEENEPEEPEESEEPEISFVEKVIEGVVQTVKEAIISTWDHLVSFFKGDVKSEDNEVVMYGKLAKDIKRETNEKLEVSKASDITLDLNGFAINSLLKHGAIEVLGQLTLEDSDANGNGMITGSTDGGIVVKNGGKFTMNGGMIGGEFTFTTEDGSNFTGNGNSKTGNGAGVEVQSGGVFIMSGGSISGNTATRKVGDTGDLGKDSTGLGGGVYVVGVGERLSNTDHTATSAEGGYFIMGGGTIENNTAAEGGGVYAAGLIKNPMDKDGSDKADAYDYRGRNGYSEDSIRFVMIDGKINNNTATTGEGGGVYIRSTEGVIFGGEITHNTTETTTDLGGGGIYIEHSGKLTAYNALITNNTANGLGGGISSCINGQSQVYADGGAAIAGNEAYGQAGKYTLTGVVDRSVNWIDTTTNAAKTNVKDAAQDVFTTGEAIVNSSGTGGNLGGTYISDKGLGIDAKWTGLAGKGNAETWSNKLDITDRSFLAMKSGMSADDIEGLRTKVTARIMNDDDAFLTSLTDSLKLRSNDPLLKDLEDLVNQSVKSRSVGVLIEGNHSNIHGGGIGNNGLFVAGKMDDGNSKNITTAERPILTVKKDLDFEVEGGDENLTFTEGSFKFTLFDDNNKELKTVSVDKNGIATFDFSTILTEEAIKDAFESRKTFTFYLTEENTGDSSITYDKRKYKVTFTISQETSKANLGLEKNKNGKWVISKKTITSYTASTPVFELVDENDVAIGEGSTAAPTFENKFTPDQFELDLSKIDPSISADDKKITDTAATFELTNGVTGAIYGQLDGEGDFKWFTLEELEELGDDHKVVLSTANGKLPPIMLDRDGTYLLRETVPPNGYEADPVTYVIANAENFQTYITNKQDSENLPDLAAYIKYVTEQKNHNLKDALNSELAKLANEAGVTLDTSKTIEGQFQQIEAAINADFVPTFPAELTKTDDVDSRFKASDVLTDKVANAAKSANVDVTGFNAKAAALETAAKAVQDYKDYENLRAKMDALTPENLKKYLRDNGIAIADFNDADQYNATKRFEKFAEAAVANEILTEEEQAQITALYKKLNSEDPDTVNGKFNKAVFEFGEARNSVLQALAQSQYESYFKAAYKAAYDDAITALNAYNDVAKYTGDGATIFKSIYSDVNKSIYSDVNTNTVGLTNFTDSYGGDYGWLKRLNGDTYTGVDSLKLTLGVDFENRKKLQTEGGKIGYNPEGVNVDLSGIGDAAYNTFDITVDVDEFEFDLTKVDLAGNKVSGKTEFELIYVGTNGNLYWDADRNEWSTGHKTITLTDGNAVPGIKLDVDRVYLLKEVSAPEISDKEAYVRDPITYVITSTADKFNNDYGVKTSTALTGDAKEAMQNYLDALKAYANRETDKAKLETALNDLAAAAGVTFAEGADLEAKFTAINAKLKDFAFAADDEALELPDALKGTEVDQTFSKEDAMAQLEGLKEQYGLSDPLISAFEQSADTLEAEFAKYTAFNRFMANLPALVNEAAVKAYLSQNGMTVESFNAKSADAKLKFLLEDISDRELSAMVQLRSADVAELKELYNTLKKDPEGANKALNGVVDAYNAARNSILAEIAAKLYADKFGTLSGTVDTNRGIYEGIFKNFKDAPELLKDSTLFKSVFKEFNEFFESPDEGDIQSFFTGSKFSEFFGSGLSDKNGFNDLAIAFMNQKVKLPSFMFEQGNGTMSVVLNALDPMLNDLALTITPDYPPSDDPDDPTPEPPVPPETPEIPEVPETPEDPNTEIEDEATPLADIADEDTPLANIADEDVPLVDLPDMDIPLAAAPPTGDSGMGMCFAVLALCGALFGLTLKKRKEEEA